MAGSGCPLTGSVDDGMQQIADLVARARTRPIDAGNGARGQRHPGVLRHHRHAVQRPVLVVAHPGAGRGDDEEHRVQLLQYADVYLDRTPDGTYTTNSNLAFTAFNCLDYPTQPRDYQQMVAFRDQVAKVAPTFADWFAMAPGCETWPFQSTRTPAPVHAAGAAPILVVGTTGDPATPYQWARRWPASSTPAPADLEGRGAHRVRARGRLHHRRRRGLPAGRHGPGRGHDLQLRSPFALWTRVSAPVQ